jgi:hypothetical protein
MQATIIAAAVSALLAAATVASQGRSAAQAQCVHGMGEDSAQRARRVAALRLAQAINSQEVNAGQRNSGQFQPLARLQIDLASAGGFESQFTTDGRGYALILRDMLDPCGFAISTNHVGVIFQGYPADYDVQPVARSR